MRNTPSIEASVRHSDIVYNLVGRDYPTKCVFHGTRATLDRTNNILGTSLWKMFMLRERNVLWRLRPSMMWTDTSTFRHTTRTPSPLLNSMRQRSGAMPQFVLMPRWKLTLHRDVESKSRAASSRRLRSCDRRRYLALKTTCC